MRLRRKPWVDTAIHAFDTFVYTRDCPPTEAMQGKWQEAFGRPAPLQVEIGTGKGDFLTGLAAQHPDWNCLGIEQQQDVLYRAAQKVSAQELMNVRLVVFDASHLEEIFAAGEIDHLYLNFCDPWPKKRHAKRRLTYQSFLETYRHLLKPEGLLSFKTDNRPLFDFSLEQFEAAHMNLRFVSYDLHAERPEGNILTEYERKFSALGAKICCAEAVFS